MSRVHLVVWGEAGVQTHRSVGVTPVPQIPPGPEAGRCVFVWGRRGHHCPASLAESASGLCSADATLAVQNTFEPA